MSPRKQPLLYLGILLILGFLLSGQYLKHVARPELGDDFLRRMMIRANHLYLLFIGLLVLTASQVNSKTAPAWIRYTVASGKVCLCLSAMVLVLAFITDHAGGFEHRSTTRFGCILALAGGILMAVNAFSPRRD